MNKINGRKLTSEDNSGASQQHVDIFNKASTNLPRLRCNYLVSSSRQDGIRCLVACISASSRFKTQESLSGIKL